MLLLVSRVSVVLLIALLTCRVGWARITRIVVDQRVSPAFDGARYGEVGQYETVAGRAYGVLDPKNAKNAVIQDLKLAPKNKQGVVEYMATFFVVKPVNMSKSSGLLWHDVPNRGGRIELSVRERAVGDIGLSSGWQGDNVGGTAQRFPNSNDYVVAPVAKSADGSSITGLVMGRIVNRSGVASQPLTVQSNPMPWKPVTLDTTNARLVSRVGEST
ncbi:MAG: hypothetical protein SGI92_03550, partial [Bryobacteraceae bacterium]|nr:hypothetical protein [Bryobacteraceae bacterium]